MSNSAMHEPTCTVDLMEKMAQKLSKCLLNIADQQCQKIIRIYNQALLMVMKKGHQSF